MKYFLWPTQRICDYFCGDERCENGCYRKYKGLSSNIGSSETEWKNLAIEVFGENVSKQFLDPDLASDGELEASVLRRFNDTEPIAPARSSVVKDEPDFLPYNYFEMGKKRGQSVCRLLTRVVVDDNNTYEWLATGFLVGRRHILTNYHVFYETICKSEQDTGQEPLLEEIPLLNGKYVAEFGYEQDYLQREVESLRYSLNKVLLYSKELDYALVEIGKEPLGRLGLQAGDWFGWLQLSRDPNIISPPWTQEIKSAFESQAKERQSQDPLNRESPITYDIKSLEKRAAQGEPVVIIQHPQGKRKQIVVSSNRTIKLYKNYLQYEADIDFGSSGSPVFNQQWQLVALHNMAILKRDQNGETNVEAEQGVRICRIVEDIHQKVTKLLENSADNKKKLYVLELWGFLNEYINASVGLEKNTLKAFSNNDLLEFLVKRLKKSELRGIWIPYIPENEKYEFSEKSMENIIKQLKKLNFNTIYISVWVYGRPTYSSKVFKQLSIEGHNNLLNLKKIVDFCKDQGLRVIAYFESGFRVGRTQEHKYSYEESWFLKKSDSEPYEKKNESDNVTYRWLNPFKSEVQKFVSNLIGEIIGDYDFDGIQLNSSFGLPPEYYDSKEHITSFNQQDREDRANQITSLMKKVFYKIKEKNGNAIVGLETGYNFKWYAQKALLDWQRWVSEGYIEELILNMSVKDKPDLPYSLLPQEVKLAFKHIPVAQKIHIEDNMTREEVKQLINNSQQDGFIGVYLSCSPQLASLESDSENSILNGLFQDSADPPTVSDF